MGNEQRLTRRRSWTHWSKVGPLSIGRALAVAATFLVPPQLVSQTPLPMPPNELMHGVSKGYTIELGSFSFVTSDEYSLEATSNQDGIKPGERATKLWFKSPVGIFRYYSADHKEVLLEGKYTNLRLHASLFQRAGGKGHEVTIPANGLFASLSVSRPLKFDTIFGATVNAPGFAGRFWNSEPIASGYNDQLQISSQSGSLQLDSTQAFTLRDVNLVVPECDLRAALTFQSRRDVRTVFRLMLGQASVGVERGAFTSAPFTKSGRSTLACGSFQAVLGKLVVDPIALTVNGENVKITTRVAESSGVFFATVGQVLPLIGSGKLSAQTVQASSRKDPSQLLVSGITTGGLRFVSAVPVTATSYRSVASQVSSALKLPDFLSPEQQQLKAIEDSIKGLDALTRPDVLVHVPAGDLQRLATAKLKQLGIPWLISFGFGKQEIVAYVPARQLKSPASLALHVAPAFAGEFVSLRPSISFAALTELTSTQMGGGLRTPAQIAAFIGQKLEPLVGPLTKLDTQVKIPIPTKITNPIDLNRSFTDQKTGAQINVTSDLKEAAVNVPHKVLLVDVDGLHIMLQVDVR